MALVDIIIPTTNRPAILPVTLKSVQAQTFSDWRCFIAEDGRTAATAAAVAPFLEDRRFVYLPGIRSGTPAAPRNRAIRAGSAPLIAFLDDDDQWLPEKLEQQVSFLEQHPKCMLLGSNAYNLTGGGDPELYFKSLQTRKLAFEELAAVNKIINSTAIIRRAVLAESGLLNESPELASCEDFDLWLRIAAAGEIWLMDKALAVYRNMPQSSIRAAVTPAAHFRKLSLAYKAAIRGDGTTPSPLCCPKNKRISFLCRNLSDSYRCQAGSFLGWRRLYFRIAAEVRNALLKLRRNSYS